MKFRIQFKDPDGVYDSMTDAVKESVAAIAGLSEDERKAVEEKRREELDSFTDKWLEYSEYVTLEFDTDEGTAVVVARR